jgi:hypothetical protein
MKQSDVVIAMAQYIEAAFQTGPAQGGESGAEGPGLADHPPHFVWIEIEHGLIWETHQKTSWHRVPECVAGLDDVTAPEFQEPCQGISRKVGARGFLDGLRGHSRIAPTKEFRFK